MNVLLTQVVHVNQASVLWCVFGLCDLKCRLCCLSCLFANKKVIEDEEEVVVIKRMTSNQLCAIWEPQPMVKLVQVYFAEIYFL